MTNYTLSLFANPNLKCGFKTINYQKPKTRNRDRQLVPFL